MTARTCCVPFGVAVEQVILRRPETSAEGRKTVWRAAFHLLLQLLLNIAVCVGTHREEPRPRLFRGRPREIQSSPGGRKCSSQPLVSRRVGLNKTCAYSQAPARLVTAFSREVSTDRQLQTHQSLRLFVCPPLQSWEERRGNARLRHSFVSDETHDTGANDQLHEYSLRVAQLACDGLGNGGAQSTILQQPYSCAVSLPSTLLSRVNCSCNSCCCVNPWIRTGGSQDSSRRTKQRVPIDLCFERDLCSLEKAATYTRYGPYINISTSSKSTAKRKWRLGGQLLTPMRLVAANRVSSPMFP